MRVLVKDHAGLTGCQHPNGFGDVGRAFQRQSEFEATLIADGGRLEDYQRLTAYR